MRGQMRAQRPYGWAVAPLAFACALAAASPARAGNVCVDAYEKGQELRLEKKLKAAAEQLAICAAASCPAATKSDCGVWLKEVELALPSIVIVTRDELGVDLADVRVTLDGGAPPKPGSSGELELDPGPHTILCEREGKEPARLAITAQESEKRRVVACVLRPAAPSPPTTSSSGSRIPTASYVLGGIGALAVAVGVVLDVKGISDRKALQDPVGGCYGHCTADQLSPVRTELIAGDVLWITGLVGLGAATAFYLVQPSPSAASSPRTSMPVFDVHPSRTGATLGVSARF